VKVAFVLGEESADRIGADIAAALKARLGENFHPIGLGGRAMGAQGLSSLFPIEELSIVGLGAILARFPQLLARLHQTVHFLLKERPDVIVTIDSFTFTNRVALRVKKAWPTARIVNVVPPAVWAYRPHRASKLARAVEHSISLFPFEPEVLASHGGPPATYVGHPLLSHPYLQPILERDALAGMRSPHSPPRLVVLPGSRRSEVSRLMKDFGRTAEILRDMHPAIEISLPTLPRVRSSVERELKSWAVHPDLVTTESGKWDAFAQADAALAASGTVSLELALAGVPMVLAYRLDPIGYMMRHLVTGWTAALPNFAAGHPLVPEHFHELIRPETLARRLARLISDTPERAAQQAGFAEIRRRMNVARPPAEAAADIILSVATQKRGAATTPLTTV
jgi:lipid-A-disaccharide synthase